MVTLPGFTVSTTSLFPYNGVGATEDLAFIVSVLGSTVPASFHMCLFTTRVAWYKLGETEKFDLTDAIEALLERLIADPEVRHSVAQILAIVDLQPQLPMTA